MNRQFSKSAAPILLSLALATSGCSKIWSTPEMQNSSSSMSTTGVSAAAGAAVGAGLGALIGSATGNAGEGFVLGAVAGAATGGLIGNELENQEEAIVEQDEVLRRHEELLDKQQRELEDLKHMSDGSPVALNTPSAAGMRSSTGASKLKEQNALLPPARTVAGAPKPISKSIRTNNVSTLHGDSGRAQLRHNITPEKESIKVSGGNRLYLKSPSMRSENQAIAIPTPASKPIPTSISRAPKPVVPAVPAVKPAPVRKSSIVASSSLPPARKVVAEKELEQLAAKKIEKPKKVAKKVIKEVKAEKKVVAKKIAVAEKKVEKKVAKTIKSPIAAVKPASGTSMSKEVGCRLAEEEAERARNASSDADKLFYFRRAIRQCPKLAVYHIEIGKVYMDIGRSEDAEFEFRQALDLDPENEQAQDQLTLLQAE